MKTRLPVVLIFAAAIVLSILFVPAKAQFLMAQPQSTDSITPSMRTAEEPIPDDVATTATPGSVPLAFIENVGQFDNRVRFQLLQNNTTIHLTNDAIWLSVFEEFSEPLSAVSDGLGTTDPVPTPGPQTREGGQSSQGVNLELTFVGSNPVSRLEPFNHLEMAVSYYLGNDPEGWYPNVPVWGGVRYVDLYPGIDLEMIDQDGQWTWRLVAREGSSLDVVRLRIEAADKVTVDGSGRLEIETAIGSVAGPVIAAAPGPMPMRAVVEEGLIKLIPSSLPGTVSGGTRIESAELEPSQGEVVYSSFLGGASFDAGHAIAVGNDGSAYIAGETYSMDFPTNPGAFDTSSNGSADIFVTKIQGDGQTLLFSAYLGGSSSDQGFAIGVDDAGATYLAGVSYSNDFPTTIGAYDTTYNGSADGVVVKLDATGGALLHSTYLGGSSADYLLGMAIDGVGAAYVTGETWSWDLPTTLGAFDPTWNGGVPYPYDAFVTKLGPNGRVLEYSTFLGGEGYERGNDIAVDSNGTVYVVGLTGENTGFPTTPGAFNTTFAGGNDVFVAKLDQSGSTLSYAGLLGGIGDDQGQGIAVDVLGAVYLTGQTNWTGFPVTPGAYQTSKPSADSLWDGFVAKISPGGDTLVYNTYLGGSSSNCETPGVDRECMIAADRSGVAYVAGRTFSADFPTTIDGFNTNYNGNEDGFMVKVSPGGDSLVYGSFFGGTSADQTLAVAVDAAGGAYAAGRTYSPDYTTTENAFDQTYNGGVDAFVVRLPVGSGLPPSPQGSLQLHMPDVLPPDVPIRPAVTVVNVDPEPASYTVVVQLWRDFGMLAEQSQNISFVSYGSQQTVFDFGIYPPDDYWLWVELRRANQMLQVESQAFVVGLDFLRLSSAVGDLTNAAYDELNDGEVIAVDALADATGIAAAETLSLLATHGASVLLGLGGVEEIGVDVASEASSELGDWVLGFSAAIEQGTEAAAANFWQDNLDTRTFNARRADVSNAADAFLNEARDETFTWDPAWQADVERYEEAIRNKNEVERVGLGIQPNGEFPFVHRATLVEMKGQFDWFKDSFLPIINTILIGLLFILIAALLVAIAIIRLDVTATALIILVSKGVATALPYVSSAFYFVGNVKIVSGTLIILLFSMMVATTAEDFTSPKVVEEHQAALQDLSGRISSTTYDMSTRSVELTAEARGQDVDVNVSFEPQGGGGPASVQLFRGDGELISFDQLPLDGDVDVNLEWKLPPGPYWAIAAARGADEMQVQKIIFEVVTSAASLDFDLNKQQFTLGEPVHIAITVANQDAVSGTDGLVLAASTQHGEGLHMWYPELGPGDSATYHYDFVPQREGGYVLRAALGDDAGTIARMEQGFVVGDFATIALDVLSEHTYLAGQDAAWMVTATNAGVQPTSTLITLNTFDRSDYTLVYSTTYNLALGAGEADTFSMDVLPDSSPGVYTTLLSLGERIHLVEDFLVEAEGALFTVVRVDPIFVSTAEPVTVTVEVQDETYTLTDAAVSLQVYTARGDIVDIVPSRIDTGTYQVGFVPEETGTHLVLVNATKSHYAGNDSRTFFMADETSLLLADIQGELALDVTSVVTVSVFNEHLLPIPDARVIASGTNGLETDFTDQTGRVSLALHPVITETVAVRIERPGFGTTSLQLPVAVISDTVSPNLSMVLPGLTNQASLTFQGVTEPGAALWINDMDIPVAADGHFTATVDLLEGVSLITAVAQDAAYNSTVVTGTIILDSVAPGLTLSWPPDGLLIVGTVVLVTGITDPDASVMVDNVLADVKTDGSFSVWALAKMRGTNVITVMATDPAGNRTTQQLVVRRPVAIYLPLIVRMP